MRKSHTRFGFPGAIGWILAVLACSPVNAASDGRGHLTPLGDVDQIVSGAAQSCATTNQGRILCWGDNLFGQLGTGDDRTSATPLPSIELPVPITSVVTSKTHTCALGSGRIWCWGGNQFGQLGDGTHDDSFLPREVQGLGGIATAVGVGNVHTCAIVDGGVKCWGNNTYGTLGDSSENDSVLPIPTTGLNSGVTQLAVGILHSCAIAAGAAYCWGGDFSGQVGDGAPGPIVRVPVAVVGLDSGMTSIAPGATHTCARGEAGKVWCWGSNDDGQLGTGNHVASDVPVLVESLPGAASAVTSGYLHSCASLADTVYCWGDNAYGELGSGANNSTVPQPIPGMNQVVRLSARGYHTCARRTDGSVFCWGFNGDGQLGDGSEEQRTAPVIVDALSSVANAPTAGAAHSCVGQANGVACWGYNGVGNLGNGDYSINESLPQAVIGISTRPMSLGAGADHSCAVVNGAVWCWGRNNKGQLGIDALDDSAVALPVKGMETGVTQVAAASDYTCAIRSGAAWCWGDNGNAQLGNGSLLNTPVPVQVSGMGNGVSRISAGANHACAIRYGAAYCWGLNSDGQLGIGTGSGYRSTPESVAGLLGGVTDISAGVTHACAIVHGKAKCWGYDGYGQLGNGILNDAQYVPDDVVELGSDIERIAAGDDIGCVLRQHSVLCWGGDYSGDLGNGGVARSQRLVPTWVIGMSGIAAGELAINGTHVCATTLDGGLRCWGDDFLGSLGIGRVVIARQPLQVMLQDQIYGNSFD